MDYKRPYSCFSNKNFFRARGAKILNIKFENAETSEALQNLDDIKIGMIIGIDFEVEL